jgi:hypothetical protein
VFPCEDGHAQERALLEQVLPTVDERDVWTMDRNFCVRHLLLVTFLVGRLLGSGYL